ncbi:hypothetical protein [Brevundimonas sp. Root1279]|uniref:hypothetical protein n=1 Tax=Brevundimonas sp. Root1279 TaxID=1736443 RepID=UPI0006FA3B45|nr:hypothetical protein [Brevundimonas sp. Root1279]KQW83130.1 hypothetical protein ASC65_07305 [Brevundimonas sp. Root1279]
MIDHPALSDEDRTPPATVAAQAARGLALREEHGRGGTEVGERRAEQLSDRRTVSDRDIKSMYSYFARHAVDKHGRDWANPKKPSAGYIAWLLWGGDPGREWINGLRARLREAQG